MDSEELTRRRKGLGLSQSDLGKAIGKSRKTINSYENGGTIPPTTEKLLDIYFDGKESQQKMSNLISQTKIDSKAITVNDPREIFNTKAGSNYEELSNGKFLLTVPLVPVRAQASYVSEFTDAEYMADLETVSFIVDRVGKGKYQAFEVQNDSMDDGTSNYIPDGAIVLGRELGRQHWKSKFRTSQYPYWIIVHRNTILCKEIIHHDVENGIITCHSLNQSPEYSDFDLELNNVKQLFNIIKKQI